MDTYQARSAMRDMAAEALKSVQSLADGKAPSAQQKQQLRQMATEARSLLADAGFPGEAVWRSLQRASMGVDTYFDKPDGCYWSDVTEELRLGLETLEALVSPRMGRESDFHIVG